MSNYTLNSVKRRNYTRLGCIIILMCWSNHRSFSQENPPSPPGQQPTLTGVWNYTVQNSEISEAGNDFPGTYESASNQLAFNRNATWRYLPHWSVSINKSDILWDSNIKLWIRRTGNGNLVPGATISNGVSYLEILNTPLSFFEGYKEINDVPLQLRITGISVIIPVDTYSTSLTFTITEF